MESLTPLLIANEDPVSIIKPSSDVPPYCPGLWEAAAIVLQFLTEVILIVPDCFVHLSIMCLTLPVFDKLTETDFQLSKKK